MAYIGQVPVPQSTENRVEITATSGQTSFTVGTYAVGFVDFYLNGVRLQNADVTATDGTTVTLASGAAAGDVLTMIARTQATSSGRNIEHSSTVSDSLSISSGTNRMYIGRTSFSSGGVTMAGTLVVVGGFANFTSASALNATGTLNVVG
jgi:hypothetical protein